jgi:hypothetical protein
MGRTIRELAQEACDVQGACNLSGVVQGFARAIADLRELPEHGGSDWLCKHPIVVAWADKVASMCHVQWDAGAERAMEAHRRCEELRRELPK